MKKFKPTKKWARDGLKAVELLVMDERVCRSTHNASLCELDRKHRRLLKDKSPHSEVAGDICAACPRVVFNLGGCEHNNTETLPQLYGWRKRFNNMLAKKGRL